MVNHRLNKGVFLLILSGPVGKNNELVFSFCFRPPSFCWVCNRSGFICFHGTQLTSVIKWALCESFVFGGKVDAFQTDICVFRWWHWTGKDNVQFSKNSVFIVARTLSPNSRVTFLKGWAIHMFRAVSYVTLACLIFPAFVERKERQYIQGIHFFLSRVLMHAVWDSHLCAFIPGGLNHVVVLCFRNAAAILFVNAVLMSTACTEKMWAVVI